MLFCLVIFFVPYRPGYSIQPEINYSEELFIINFNGFFSTHFNSTFDFLSDSCLCYLDFFFPSVIADFFFVYAKTFVNCLLFSLSLFLFSFFFVYYSCARSKKKPKTNTLKTWIMNAMEKHNRVDPMEMSYLLGIAGGCLTAVLLLVCLCIYAIRARKCCFKGKFVSGSLFHVNFNYLFDGTNSSNNTAGNNKSLTISLWIN